MARVLVRVGSISWATARRVGVILRRVLLAPFRWLGAILRSFRFWLLVLLLALIVLVAYYIVADRDTPLTTDAYLKAYVVRAAPQVAGKVVRVAVAEGQEVHRGDVLFEVDHRPFEHRVAMAEASVVLARRDVEYSTVVATCDGRITNLQLREGDFVHVGESALSVVDSAQWRIVANYRERSLERMRPGQEALITFRGAPGLILRGRVDPIGVGVLQGQGLPLGNLPAVEQLRNWVPPSQRFQLRLTLEDPHATELRVGMTCTVTTLIRPATPVAPVARFVHRLVALWYYF